MKKIVAAVVAVLVVCAAGFAAWQGYRAVFTEPDAYYAQVDADKLSSAGENNTANCATEPTSSSRRWPCAA